jgi:hypothetical protein
LAKHRGTPEREVNVIAGRVIINLDPADLPLMERLLMDYANAIYWGGSKARTLYGYSMRYDEARSLAQKIQRVRRG